MMVKIKAIENFKGAETGTFLGLPEKKEGMGGELKTSLPMHNSKGRVCWGGGGGYRHTPWREPLRLARKALRGGAQYLSPWIAPKS